MFMRLVIVVTWQTLGLTAGQMFKDGRLVHNKLSGEPAHGGSSLGSRLSELQMTTLN